MLEDLKEEDMLLLTDEEEGSVLYTVVSVFPDEGLFLYSVEFINGKKISNVKNLNYNAIRGRYQYNTIKRDGTE